MKVVILCGGFGTRLREGSESLPKPMVRIGSKPILWHIMKTYAHFGFKDFIICLGYKGEAIKDFFLNYRPRNSDFSVELGTGHVELHGRKDEVDWRVTLVDTGLNAMTGARVKRVEQYIDGDRFMLTYGDGVTDLNIPDLVGSHEIQGKIGTVTAVTHPSSYGDLIVDAGKVVQFHEKPEASGSLINGGFFVFQREFLKYLSSDEDCVLEREPLERLAQDGELAAYSHQGYWHCMDTYRDMIELNKQWDSGNPPWRVWE